jgi:hypothetical protein
MNKNKLLVLFLLRLLIFGLFTMSGILKLYPSIVPFEKQLVDLGFVNWCQAPYMARFIIALEMALGFAFLFSHYLRKIIIPITSIVLIAFCIHLSYIIYTQGANSGNCGCFGQLIPMTPLQALLKNIVTLGILAYMYLLYKEKEKNSFSFLLILFLATNLGIFLLYPFCPCNSVKADEEIVVTIPTDSSAVLRKDTIVLDTIVALKQTNYKESQGKSSSKKVDTAQKVVVQEIQGDKLCLSKKVSAYAPYKKFNTEVVDLDEGRKIVTLFSLDCEHCMETAKKIGELAKRRKLPPTYFLFWGTEDQVENFFKVAQCRYPYKIIDPSAFFQLLGSLPSPPKVSYMCNGNVIAEFDTNSFSAEKLDEALNR